MHKKFNIGLSVFNRGFTLIELLVVIAIIGILSTIVMANLVTARGKGRDAKRITDIKNIQLALETYYSDNNAYPVNMYAASGSLSPTYLSKVPTDPNSSVVCTVAGTEASCYKYASFTAASSANCGLNSPVRYHIGALLEQTSNSTLSQDADADPSGTPPTSPTQFYLCNNSVSNFDGTSAGGSGQCNSTPGVAQGSANATEACFDVTNN